MKLYFAHQQTMYGTEEEAEIIRILELHGYEVVNPGSREIKDAFEAYLAEHPDDYMQFFVDLCKSCDACVFTTFGDDLKVDGVPDTLRRVGAGVAMEVESFWQRSALVYAIKWQDSLLGLARTRNWSDGDGYLPLDKDQTRALLKAIDPDYKSRVST